MQPIKALSMIEVHDPNILLVLMYTHTEHKVPIKITFHQCADSRIVNTNSQENWFVVSVTLQKGNGEQLVTKVGI